MRVFGISLVLNAFISLSNGAPSADLDPRSFLDSQYRISSMSNIGLWNLQFWDFVRGGFFSGRCNYYKASTRTEWRNMPQYMRKQFTDAVTCLHSKPSKMSTPYPGVKSRYDDYTALHIEQNRWSHFTGMFLAWHRYVIWSFEQDLRNMCGYTGYLPYWDWGMDAMDPVHSSMFNGDAYSMGSNGAYIPRSDPIYFKIPIPPALLSQLPGGVTNISVPGGTGTGGGCLTTGPFSNLQANMGPIVLDAYGPAIGLLPNMSFTYNPRCIKRDINPWVTTRFLTWDNISNVLTNYPTIEYFQAKMQADSRYSFTQGDYGLHAGGHIGVGGDPLADQPSTPGDPLWFLHHAQIDRLWFIWQNQDIKNRLNAIAGTTTILNIPPSANVTLAQPIDLSYVGGAGPLPMSSLMSTLSGPFCYIYK